MSSSGTVYLTFSCYHHFWLFKDSHLYTLYQSCLDKARESHGFELYAYVIMPNHVHVLMSLPEERPLPSILRALKQPFSVQALRYLRAHYPLLAEELVVTHGSRNVQRFWQAGGGYHRPVRTRRAARQMIDYIHNNPVRRGLVQLPEEWAWSSARFWLEETSSPLLMDDPGGWL